MSKSEILKWVSNELDMVIVKFERFQSGSLLLILLAKVAFNLDPSIISTI